MRRRVVWGLFGVSVMGAPAIGRCQVYPVKPIRVLVGFPAGGAADTTPRILAPVMGEALKQQMVIDNRGGAHGNIASEIVVNGLTAPATTPRAIIAKLSTVVRAALERKEVREKLLAQGLDPSWTSPKEFGAYLKSETEKWSRVARDARVVAE